LGKNGLDEIEVVHVDWRMLNADQHLAGGRGRRFWNLDMLEDIRRLPESFYPHCAHSLPPLLRETAEHDEIQTGERASGLLHAATNHQTAELDRHEAKALDQLLDDCIGLGVVPGNEDHATSAVLHRPFIEAGGDDRIESLDDAGAWRQGSHDLASALPTKIGEDELPIGLDERIRRIDEHAAVPGGQALQR